MGLWDDDFGMKIVWGILKTMGKIFLGVSHAVANGVRGLFQNRQIARIRKNNDESRGVQESLAPTAVAALAPYMQPTGKVLVSGLDQEYSSPWRNVFAAAFAKHAVARGVGVLVLHNGDEDMLARLQQVVPEEQLFFVGPENPVYDPLKGCDEKEIVSLLLNKKMEPYVQNDACGIYLQGLVRLFIRGWKVNPSLMVLKNLSESPVAKVQQLAQSKLDSEDYQQVNAQLQAGASARSALLLYLNRLMDSLASAVCRDEMLKISQTVNVRQAAAQRKVLAVDISSVSTDARGLALLLNEIDGAIKENKIALVLDNPDLLSFETLRRFIRSEYKGGLCLTTQDLFAGCADSEKDFAAIASGCSLCVVMSHSNGDSAEAWQKFFGSYHKMDITYHINRGRGRNHGQFFGNSNEGEDVGFAEKDEPRVRAEQIMQIPTGNVYIRRRDSAVILHTVLDDTI